MQTGRGELCFVWGPPLSGQKYWMERSARLTDPAIPVHILPLETYTDNQTLESVLKRLTRVLTETPRQSHIYCELPWSIIDEDLTLEEWLGSHDVFQGPDPAMNISFAGICSWDAHRLPQEYRTGLEEFSRASQSGVIVVRGESDPTTPEWWGTAILDFGKRVQVFEEAIWPSTGEDVRFEEAGTELEFMNVIAIPAQGTRETFYELMRDLCGGRYGALWGAEVCYRNPEGLFESLTVAQGRLHRWTSNQPSLVNEAPMNGGLFNIAGDLRRSQELITALRSQSFC